MRRLSLSIGALACAACTWGGYDGGGASSSGGSADTTITPEGGVVFSSDGQFHVAFPFNAVTETTTVSIGRVQTKSGSFYPDGYVLETQPPFEGVVTVWFEPSQNVPFPYDQVAIALVRDGTPSALALGAGWQTPRVAYFGVTNEPGEFWLVNGSTQSPWTACNACNADPTVQCPECCGGQRPCNVCGGECLPCGQDDPYAYMDCLDGCAAPPVNPCGPCARACAADVQAERIQTLAGHVTCQITFFDQGAEDKLADCLIECGDEGGPVTTCE